MLYAPLSLCRKIKGVGSCCDGLAGANFLILTFLRFAIERRPAYFCQRYAQLWLRARIRAVYEPLSVFVVCVWLSYGAGGNDTLEHIAEAAVFGAFLAASFAIAVASLTIGLWLGWSWREMPPPGVPWFWLQKMEMLPTLLHAAILTHWSRLIGRVSATPVWALLYEMGFAASILHVLDPLHALFLQVFILTHHSAVLGWEATHDADAQAHIGLPVWLDAVYTIFLEILAVDVLVLFVGATQIEWMRREDWRVKGRAMLQRNVLAQLISNFLPVSVALGRCELEDGSTDPPRLFLVQRQALPAVSAD